MMSLQKMLKSFAFLELTVLLNNTKLINEYVYILFPQVADT